MNLVCGRVYNATFLVPTHRGHAFVPNVRAKFLGFRCPELLVFETAEPVSPFSAHSAPCVVVVDRWSVVVSSAAKRAS